MVELKHTFYEAHTLSNVFTLKLFLTHLLQWQLNLYNLKQINRRTVLLQISLKTADYVK